MSVSSPQPDVTAALTPAFAGTLRDCTSRSASPAKLRAGDIVIVDTPDMTRREAEALIAAQPVAVINLSDFSTGSTPHFGPHMLLDADIALFDGAGANLQSFIRDGKKASVTDDGEIVVGRKHAGRAHPVERAEVDANFDNARQGLVDHMEAYFGNTIEFIHSESPLLIDGVGVPDMGESIAGHKVLVVSSTPDTSQRLDKLRNFIREYSPVIIGVGAASDTLVEQGYDPDFIVGDPVDISADSLRGQARVILPADPDGHALGLERIQDLGVGAMTFPAAADSPVDLAILLAAFHDAEMIVTVGEAVDLDRIFANSPQASPSALLTRLKAGRTLVDSTVIESLYRTNTGTSVAWAWAVLGILVALATAITIVGLSGSATFNENLVNTWNQIALSVQSWFN